jgi:hypothetical protein
MRNQAFIEQGRNRSLFLFSKIHPVRRFCTNLIEKKGLFNLFLTLIYVSNVLIIAFETYYPYNSFYFGILNPTNDFQMQEENEKSTFYFHLTIMILSNIATAIEILVKSIANGFLLAKKSCIRQPLNLVDFFFLFLYFLGFAIKIPYLYKVIIVNKNYILIMKKKKYLYIFIFCRYRAILDYSKLSSS